MKSLAVIVTLLCSVAAFGQATPQEPSIFPQPRPGDFTEHNFQFKTGDHLDIRIHYYTLGSPVKGANGQVGNAVLILHGTGGSGRSLLVPMFAGKLFCPGCLLDATKYFIISPDNLGHGDSSKPSDGMRMSFPHYDYDEMVLLQHQLLTEALHIDHLRLVIGTSMGCMHTWLWAEQYPDFIDAAMPLACLPVEVSGRNRMWRKMLVDGVRNDPAWNNGNYTQQPLQGLRLAEDMLLIAVTAPLYNQMLAPTRDAADRNLDDRFKRGIDSLDANDLLYQIDASRNYNPSPKLDSIRVPVMAVNSADDFVNPPELGILEREIKRVKRGCAVVLPITDQTRGHGTHTFAAIWGSYLAELLEKSGGAAPGTSWSGSRSAPNDRQVCSLN
jgi:homoserine O-acetyltransferase/O-succinyltransferase